MLFGVEGLQVIDAGPGAEGTVEVWAVTDHLAAGRQPALRPELVRNSTRRNRQPRGQRLAESLKAETWPESGPGRAGSPSSTTLGLGNYGGYWDIPESMRPVPVPPQARVRIAPPTTSAAIVPASHSQHHADRQRKVIPARIPASATSSGLLAALNARLVPKMSKNQVTP